MNINDFCKYALGQLDFMDKAECKCEIKILLEEYLNLDFTQIILNKQTQIPQDKLPILLKAVDLRKSGVPIQYILGYWDFMGMRLCVGNGVLIPREDTTVLVDFVLSKMKFKNKAVIADLCSGSGCIAFALEKALGSDSQVYAVELSDKAYYYLDKNKKKLKSSITTIHGDIFKIYNQFPDNYFDVVVSNPPYIKSEDMNSLQREVLHEPRMALDGGENGLYFYENICKFWIPKIKKHGLLGFEIGAKQFADVKYLMNKYNLNIVDYKKDINGIIRSIVGVKG